MKLTNKALKTLINFRKSLTTPSISSLPECLTQSFFSPNSTSVARPLSNLFTNSQNNTLFFCPLLLFILILS